MPLAEVPIRMPKPYADQRNFTAPSVRRLDDDSLVVSVTHRSQDKGHSISDWNEPFDYSTGETSVYIIKDYKYKDVVEKRMRPIVQKAADFGSRVVESVIGALKSLWRRK